MYHDSCTTKGETILQGTHVTTLTDNQPHNTFQAFYMHVGHVVRLQSGLHNSEHNIMNMLILH